MDLLVVTPRLIYLLSVFLGGFVIYFVMRAFLDRVENQQIKNVKKKSLFIPVRTKTPIENFGAEAKAMSVESIGGQFSVIRRVLFIAAAVVWMAALLFPFLGETPQTVVSILSAAGAVIVGIAAKPFVENVISGMVLSLSDLLHIGDTLFVDDHFGTVEDISLTHTTVRVWDWRRYVISNCSMLQKDFLNYSLVDSFQWAWIEFWVDYSADVNEVKQLALDIASQSPFSMELEPGFWVMEMSKEGYKCWLAAWAPNPTDAWALKNMMRTQLIIAMQEKGIRTHSYRCTMHEAFPPIEAPPGS